MYQAVLLFSMLLNDRLVTTSQTISAVTRRGIERKINCALLNQPRGWAVEAVRLY
jgi:hypothetical protein